MPTPTGTTSEGNGGLPLDSLGPGERAPKSWMWQFHCVEAPACRDPTGSPQAGEVRCRPRSEPWRSGGSGDQPAWPHGRAPHGASRPSPEHASSGPPAVVGCREEGGPVSTPEKPPDSRRGDWTDSLPATPRPPRALKLPPGAQPGPALCSRPHLSTGPQSTPCCHTGPPDTLGAPSAPHGVTASPLRRPGAGEMFSPE